MVVSSFVWPYSTAHHCDGSTRPGPDTGIKAAPCEMYFWVGVLLLGVGWGGESREDSFLMSVPWVKEGIGCLGLGNGLLGTDSSAPH